MADGNGAWRREWDVLARYNSERARGLVHTPEWQAHMAEVQHDFDEAHAPPPKPAVS